MIALANNMVLIGLFARDAKDVACNILSKNDAMGSISKKDCRLGLATL
jgi:hypothetical protein